MKYTTKPMLSGALLLLAATSAANSATLKVDINADHLNEAGGPNQSGFTSYVPSEGAFEVHPTPGYFSSRVMQTTFAYADAVAGNVTFTISRLNPEAARNERDRGAGNPANAGDFSYADLYRDFVFKNIESADPGNNFDVTFSSLQASTEYTFKFYAYDGNSPTNGNTHTFTLNTTAVAFASSVDLSSITTYTTSGATATAVGNNYVTATGAPTTNDQYAVLFNGTTNSSGVISFTQSGSLFPVLNGFEISQIPEPSSFAILTLGLAGLLRRKRA